MFFFPVSILPIVFKKVDGNRQVQSCPALCHLLLMISIVAGFVASYPVTIFYGLYLAVRRYVARWRVYMKFKRAVTTYHSR